MIIKREFPYSPDDTDRTLHIYLPEGYDESEERYPVMYFFDGHNLFSDEDATYGVCWRLKDFLDSWDMKMIIVGLECSHVPNGRMCEYSPYKGTFGDFIGIKEPLGDATMQWIVNDIKPMIDKEYRTWWHREATGIAGSSMGGLMALYGVTKYNEWFSKGACVSSALVFCMRGMMKDIRQSQIADDTRVFLSWGTREARARRHNHDDHSTQTYKRNKRVADEIGKSTSMVQLYSQQEGHHCEAAWADQVPVFMDYLWK